MRREEPAIGVREFWDYMAEELGYVNWDGYLKRNGLDLRSDFEGQSEGILRLKEMYLERLMERLGAKGS